MNRVDHGPTISDEEYNARICKLHEDRYPLYSDEDEEAVQKGELSITIDHRLGILFPYDRRDDLWDAQKNIQSRRGRFYFLLFLQMLGFGSLSELVWEEYSKVLSPEEMQDYFGEDFDASA